MVNKWDLVEDKDANTARRGEEALFAKVPLLEFVPFVYTSALTGQRVHRLLDLILEVADARQHRVPTAEVNRVLQALLDRAAPPQRAGEAVKLLYASQIRTGPPTIAIVSNRPDAVPGVVPALPGARLSRGVGIQGRAAALADQPAREQVVTPAIAGAVAGSYLLGSIPTSFWVARVFKGIDLRTVGSGNLGATNLYRVLGWRVAVPVAAFDCAKGAVPVAVIAPWAGMSLAGAAALGLVALLGHVFSIFVGFRGGKGVATGAGVVLGFAPVAFVAVLAIWAAVLRLSGYVSLASISAAIALPPAVWILEPSRRSLVAWFAGVAAVIIWMHRANIRRLLDGTEHRFGRSTGALP